MGSIDERPLLRRALLNAGLLVLGVIAAVLVAETAIRIVHAFVFGHGTRYYYPIVSDPVLGWKAVENFSSWSTKHDAAGNPYEVRFSTNAQGFRLFGDPGSTRPKVLIVGDSYTHAVDAGDGDTYFSYLRKVLHWEVFAYGAGGYGTLQEYMVLDRDIDRIRPDLIIVQFAANDFANNSFELERRSSNNNSRYRPYLMHDGSVRLAYPARTGISALLAGTRTWLASHLRIMNELFRAADILEPRLLSLFGFTYVDPEIVARNGDVPVFRDAIGTTTDIFRMIVRRAGKASVYAFSADDPEPYYSAFRAAAAAAGVIVIEAAPRSLEQGPDRRLFAMDRSHWSPAGHRAVGEALAAYFIKEGLHVRSH